MITPGNYALSITWSAPAEDGGSAITSYDLRYIRSDATDKADDNWTVREDIWSSGLLQYGLNESTGFDLSSGVQYDVQVRAVNAVADSLWSASETGTPRKPQPTVTAPSAPASLTVTPGDGSPGYCLVRTGKRRRGGISRHTTCDTSQATCRTSRDAKLDGRVGRLELGANWSYGSRTA